MVSVAELNFNLRHCHAVLYRTMSARANRFRLSLFFIANLRRIVFVSH